MIHVLLNYEHITNNYILKLSSGMGNIHLEIMMLT